MEASKSKEDGLRLIEAHVPAGAVIDGLLDDAPGSISLDWLCRCDALASAAPASRDECYAVRRPIWNDALLRLGGEIPSVDGFANPQLHLLDRWWGPGSSIPNSLEVPWGEEPLLWLNPPFSLLPQVIHKLKKDRARAIVVFPHWEN